MPTTRRLPAVLFLAALLLSACARGHEADPNATAAPAIAPTTTPQTSGRPETPPSTNDPPVDRPGPRRCAAAALRGSIHGSDGAAGTSWSIVQLRNASARTCTVRGSPKVQLLSAQVQPLFASTPARPGGALVTLRPGTAAQFALAVSNVCDHTVGGSHLRVTLTPRQGSLVVPLGDGLTTQGLATCRSLGVQPLEPATA
jgi:Domain of unknown function (DUF4232)